MPEDSFNDHIDHEAPLKPTPPVSNGAAFKSFAVKILLILGILVSVYAVANFFMAPNPSKQTSLASLDNSQGNENPPKDGSSDKTIKPPKDEGEKSDRNPEHNQLKTDSGGDGREPPNNNHWNTIYRGNINSDIGGLPIREREEEATPVESMNSITGRQSETDKPKSSSEETDDEEKIDEYDILRGPDFREIDPRSSSIGNVRP